MKNSFRELSSSDLDDVSGGLRGFPFVSVVPPNAPLTLPLPLGHGPAIPPSHGPIVFNGGPGVFEL
jgi:hypothetical protein